MTEPSEAISTPDSALPAGARASVLAGRWSRLGATGRESFKDAIAGLLGSVILVANIVSFGALMFPGEFSAGIPVAIWAMLIGGCICGLFVATMTSLPPLASGIDSPTGAVLVLLSADAGRRLVAAGVSPHDAVATVMLIFSAATVLSGVLFYVLGACRGGSYFRFVPSFVVGGFLTATGYFLIAGAVRMAIGRTFTFAGLSAPWTTVEMAKLASAVAALSLLLLLRRFVKSAYAMPAALLVMWLLAAMALRDLQLTDPAHGWYLHSLGKLVEWLPFAAVSSSHLTWPTLVRLVPELLAVTIVSLISLVTKVSSIEVARQASADLDREFRAHGIGHLVAAPFGGITASLQVGTSRLLDHVGCTTRTSALVSSLAMGAVGIASFNLPGLVPIPIVAGLVFYLGYTFIVEALTRPYAQRAWLDLTLAIAIGIVCIVYGYLIGVLAGLLSACMLFVISYARLGVVRRHVTRAQFASHVDRSLEASAYLRQVGDAIQLYWLSGYIFFGSSEGVFERIRDDVEALPPHRVAYVILDFGMVSGADSSAFISLGKLRNFCGQRGVTLVYCALSAANRAALERGGFFGGKSPHQAFADLNLALAWCEDRLLAKSGLDPQDSLAEFESWLQRQLGDGAKAADVIVFLQRKDVAGAEVLYREGEPADTFDLVAAGHLVVDIRRGDGATLRVRRIMTHTVVGEMGFFRGAMRSATVSADGPAVLFTMTRANFERMRRERPDVASAFDDFIIRVLADRIDIANREVAALEPLFTSDSERALEPRRGAVSVQARAAIAPPAWPFRRCRPAWRKLP